MSKPYGFIYDKQGNKKVISAPVNASFEPITVLTRGGGSITEYALTLKPAKKHTKTLTGKLHSSVGYPGFPSK